MKFSIRKILSNQEELHSCVSASFGKIMKHSALLCLTLPLIACTHMSGQKLVSNELILVEPEVNLPTAQYEIEADYWARIYAENPENRYAAVNLSRFLRKLGRDLQARLIMKQVFELYPKDIFVLIEFAYVLLQNMELEEGKKIVDLARRFGASDWRLFSAYGATLDQSGAHEDARIYHEYALLASPNNPSVLSNLGLSYALDRQIERAVEMLRKAAAYPNASPRVHENLALVLEIMDNSNDQTTEKQQDPKDQSGNRKKQKSRRPDGWAKLRNIDKNP